MPFSSMVSHPKLSAILENDKKVYRLFDIALPWPALLWAKVITKAGKSTNITVKLSAL